MCDLKYLVFRQGTILSADVKFTRSEALKIADRIVVQQDLFVDESLRVLGDDDDDWEPDNCAGSRSNKKSSMRIWPTIIVDLPPIRARFKGYQVEIRSCVTVCVNDRQSKCWTRVNLIDDLPADLTPHDIFVDFELFANRNNVALTAIYERILTEKTGAEVTLSSSYKIHIRTASGDDEEYDEYFDHVFVDGQAADDLPRIAKDIKATTRTIHSGMDSIPNPGSAPNGESENTVYKQIGFSSSRDVRCVEGQYEISNSVKIIYALKYNETSAEFAGVGFDKFMDKVEYSDALSQVASGNLAAEYGELF